MTNQKFESVKELSTYEDVQLRLIKIKPKTNINFPVTFTINFADNVWVFNEFQRFTGEDWAYSFDFTPLDITYRSYVKYTILRQLFKIHNRFTTVKAKYYVIKDFINYLTENHIFYPDLIDTTLVEKFLKGTKTERVLADKKQAIKNFLSEIELRVPEVNFSDVYIYLNKHNTRKVKIERQQGKHKFVPIDLHNKIISIAIQDLRNQKLPITQRAAACMIVICAETGIRIGEFRILEVDKLDEIRVKGDSKTFNYLNFKTYKTVKEKDFKWTRSFITENAYLAYNTLTNLFKDKRKTKFLFVKENGTEVSKTLLRYRLVEFFYRHQRELQLDKMVDREIEQFAVTRKRNFKSLKFVPDSEMDNDIFYVTFHQYRVVLATILYNKGYHLDFIRQHMNHLTEEMTQHYIRLNEMEKLEVNAIETLMKRSVKDGTTLITNTNETSDKYISEELQSKQYQELYANINKFLKKNKLNIFKDIHEIISKLSKLDNPIADMELGICAKSFNKLCKRNEYISSINDAYYLGTQVHSLDELPYSVKRFQEKASIITYNENLYKKNPKYRNEFERELKGIRKYIERKLNPELQMLRNKLKENGTEEIYKKYPKLSEIVSRISEIEKEVQQWSYKTL
ncbi:TPA: tyrosine-type recombinase/integrase [Salmonella enterica subsp. enterica serovar Typhi str. AG3]|nr:tyrosine-type recombinase/integrase [Salmonella enterica subsp. enterica serovar Typhi str. AG3]